MPPKLKRKAKPRRRPHVVAGYDVSNLQPPCFQCELDIPHVCYHGIHRPRGNEG